MKTKSKIVALLLCIVLCMTSIVTLTSCNDDNYRKNKNLDTTKDVRLTIVGRDASWPELTRVIAKFEEIYPNVRVIYDPIESSVFTTNLPKRLANNLGVDIFVTGNIQETGDYTIYKEYALNLTSAQSKEILDLSKTYAGIVNNFKYREDENALYAIPYGCEMRGMYVNVTLLNKYGLEVPTNRRELLECCEKLFNEGYVPIQGSVASAAQQLLYPYICNSIVNGGNYEAAYAEIEAITPGIARKYFADAYSFFYSLVSTGYYDYKRVESDTNLGYKFSGEDGQAKDFLNIRIKDDETYEKVGDVGNIAFMPKTQAFQIYLDKNKADYHSQIEYKFIASPVGEDGAYAYLSPADALAINKNSDNIEWALEFFNFLFTPSINRDFNERMSKIPNTYNALIEYDISDDRICDVGQATFSYSQFYTTVVTLLGGGYNLKYQLTDLDPTYLLTHEYDEDSTKFPACDGPNDMIGMSKMNAPKYMAATPDTNGDYVLVGSNYVKYDATNTAHASLARYTLTLRHTLDDYLNRLEEEFQKLAAARQ